PDRSRPGAQRGTHPPVFPPLDRPGGRPPGRTQQLGGRAQLRRKRRNADRHLPEVTMATLFWACLMLLAFTYLGYPLLLALMLRMPHQRQPATTRGTVPTVDVLLVVHDAATQLARKLDNLVALDYPPDRVRINVVCDGCTDTTEAIARNHPSS